MPRRNINKGRGLYKKMKKLNSSILLALTLFTPLVAGAQSGVQPVPVPASVNIPNLIADIINFLFGLLLVLAALFVFYAAYLYLTASGNEQNAAKARSYIIYAVVAIVVAFLSRAIIALVRNILGV